MSKSFFRIKWNLCFDLVLSPFNVHCFSQVRKTFDQILGLVLPGMNIEEKIVNSYVYRLHIVQLYIYIAIKASGNTFDLYSHMVFLSLSIICSKTYKVHHIVS